MIQVTMKVAFKVTTCLKRGKHQSLKIRSLCRHKVLREKNFGRGDFKLCILPMGLHS